MIYKICNENYFVHLMACYSVAIALALLLCVNAQVQFPVTSDEDQSVRATAQTWVDFLNFMSRKYGDFNSSLSFSSGSLAVLNLTVTGNICFPPPLNGGIVGMMYPEYSGFLQNYALPTFTYLEHDSNDGNPFTINVSGVIPVACGLLNVQVFSKDYLQTQTLQNCLVFKTKSAPLPHTFVAQCTTRTLGLSAAEPCESDPFCFLSGRRDPNAETYDIDGYVQFTVVRQSGDYLLAQFEGWSAMAIYGGVFQGPLTNFAVMPNLLPGANF